MNITGIKVRGTRSVICPGMIDTDFHNFFTKDQLRAKVSDMVAIKRNGTSQEVANLTAFLASDQSSFMTGKSVDIYGSVLFS